MNSDNEKKYVAYFAMSRYSDSVQLPENAVLIYPSSGHSWNDFGHRTLFEFIHVGSLPDQSPHTFRLAFLNSDKQPAAVIEEALSRTSTKFVSSDELSRFFSLQTDMDGYRSIVSQYGVEDAQSILVALNDLVAVRRSQPVPEWVDDAVKLPAFNLSLVRDSDSFFAYFNGESVLAGLKSEDLTATETNLAFKFRLDGFVNEHVFNFKFDPKALLPKRISMLIGKNGVGKSQTLNRLVLAALGGWDSLVGREGRRPQISRIVAVSTPGETEATFPPVPIERANIRYFRLSAVRGEKADTGGQTLPEVIVRLARHPSTIGDTKRWTIFSKAIAELFPSSSLYLVPAPSSDGPESSVNGSEALGAVNIEELTRGYRGELRSLEAASRTDRNGQLMMRLESNKYVPLSSGQLSFIRLAAQLCLHIENGALVLIDEPETHLHPNLVTQLISMLNKILNYTGSIAIIATHSPYLVREVPSSQVHVIREDSNGAIEIVHPRLRTFGADIGAISSFVFNDDIVNSLIEEIVPMVNSESQKPYNDEGWRAQLKGELSTEAEMYLMCRLSDSRENIS